MPTGNPGRKVVDGRQEAGGCVLVCPGVQERRTSVKGHHKATHKQRQRSWCGRADHDRGRHNERDSVPILQIQAPQDAPSVSVVLMVNLNDRKGDSDMKRTFARGLYVVVFGWALLAMGCAGYYKVTDPASGKVYYTEKVSTENKGGAVKLKDARSKAVVTLQNSEVIEISKDEYQAGLATPAAAPVAPAAAPAAATPAAEPAATPAASPESK